VAVFVGSAIGRVGMEVEVGVGVGVAMVGATAVNSARVGVC
jgi:hypothetical protein